MKVKNVYIKDIQSGEKVTDSFLVTEKNLAFSQKGSPYLNLRLKDRTGQVDGKIWDNAQEWDRQFRKGDVVQVNARAVSFKNALQLSIHSLTVLDDSDVLLNDYLPTARGNIEAMFGDLQSFIDRIETPPLKKLLKAFFDDRETAERFKRAPAAKGFHHIYLGGLLEHTHSVTRLLDQIASHYPGVNRDLLLTGGILHDIGKIREFSYDRLVEYSDEGRLIGHIIIGVEMVDQKIAGIPDFPESLAMELRHLILSHHGILEYGSPKRPKTLEALMVHYVDDLDAKVNAFQEYLNDFRNEETGWTTFHRFLERYLYRGRLQEGTADEPLIPGEL
ncbi:3'-5' exoribonuclease YhaM family protein [Syntrophus gentianae]|uniref:3'-5' exoribonuclease YhaM family protein n=1 Tax=Syntrophus gentianae TaxID=43775 RepID=UPI001587A979|nr:HD domain-containing protein [Syntrophus gentianae]